MDAQMQLAERFEEQRSRLRAVAYRMLGSLSEAEDAVQEAWLRLNRSDRSDVQHLDRWLTTVVARVCLNMLEARRARREDPWDVHLPDPIIGGGAGEVAAPEQEALLADSVGLALLVVLETLGPAERLAYVLHDMFGMSFDEIAPLVGRNSAAARQLASRARRRIQGAPTSSDADLGAQREVVDAFLTAARGGDLEGLLAVLAPDVELRVDEGQLPLRVVRGARAVAGGAVSYQRLERIARPAVVNGAAGLVSFEGGRAVSVLGFTIVGKKIVRMDILADPVRLDRLQLAPLLSAQ